MKVIVVDIDIGNVGIRCVAGHKQPVMMVIVVRSVPVREIMYVIAVNRDIGDAVDTRSAGHKHAPIGVIYLVGVDAVGRAARFLAYAARGVVDYVVMNQIV